MNENENDPLDYNRRDFLKGGSVATLMTMLGGVELLAAESAPAPTGELKSNEKVKVAVIGLGAWGREILNTLGRMPMADIAAICDTYPSSLRRAATAAPGAIQTPDYKTILANNDIKAVIIDTPTHLHKDITLDSLKAGKHTYCEAPLANTIEDARTIALAGKASKLSLFQVGLQIRSDPERHFLVPFIRSGALGRFVMARAQSHKKQSWRTASPNPEREKALNWRLDKDISIGLVGEQGCHPIDQANWFLNALPLAVTGFSTMALWDADGRQVPDTVRAMIEYPGHIYLDYDATLANSFDGNYEMFYGSDAAVLIRDNKAWLFKETDAPLLGWEVYARKDKFYEETGIALVANASKSVQQAPKPGETEISNPILMSALDRFLKNASDAEITLATGREAFKDDPDSLADTFSEFVKKLASSPNRATAGSLEGYQATVIGIKANEAAIAGKRIEINPDLYKLS
jgi:predicted dehydrogenase